MRLAAVVAVLLAAVVAALVTARVRWSRDTAAAVDQLLKSVRPRIAAQDVSAELATLPGPVQRYLARALAEWREGASMVQSARIEQAGEFSMKPGPNGWRPFSATHYAVAQPPGFVWDARISMTPVSVVVRDALLNGTGSTSANIAGVKRVAHAAGTPEIAAGALHRYLAEAVWFPTALLPSAGVQWAAVDSTTARATLSTPTATVSLDFHFGPDGLVERVYTPARARAVGNATAMTPWEGRFTRYETRNGLLIPIDAEVAWLLPEGRQPYWRGRLTKIEYRF